MAQDNKAKSMFIYDNFILLFYQNLIVSCIIIASASRF